MKKVRKWEAYSDRAQWRAPLESLVRVTKLRLEGRGAISRAKSKGREFQAEGMAHEEMPKGKREGYSGWNGVIKEERRVGMAGRIQIMVRPYRSLKRPQIQMQQEDARGS